MPSAYVAGTPFHRHQCLPTNYGHPATYQYMSEWRYYGARLPSLPEATRPFYHQCFSSEGDSSKAIEETSSIPYTLVDEANDTNDNDYSHRALSTSISKHSSSHVNNSRQVIPLKHMNLL